MKLSQFTTVLGCLLLVGCQSSSSLPSKLSSSLFGPSKSDQLASADASMSPSGITLSSEEFRKGEEFLKKGKLKQAEESFLAVVKQNPENAEAHHRLGYIADKKGDFAKSEIHYITAVKLAPNNADIACDLGYSYLLQGRLAESQKYLEKALTSNPQHKASLLNMASLLGKQGDYDGALAIFRNVDDEQQAQKNIAQLFPQGRPGGDLPTSLAGQSNQQASPNQGSLDWQKEMAALSETRSANQQRPVQRTPLAASMGFREVPSGQINDEFARIDQDFAAKKKLNSNSAPGNRLASPYYQGQPLQSGGAPVAQMPQQGIPQYGQQVIPASNNPASIPGNLLAGQLSGSLDDYAILQPQQQPVPTQLPPVGMNQGGVSPSGSFYQTNGTNPPSPYSQQQNQILQNGIPAQSISAEMNPAYPTQNPGTLPVPRTGTVLNNSALQSNAVSYQDAVAIAVQMGMDAGPGQMFPVNRQGTENTGGVLPRVPNYPSSTVPPLGIGSPNRPNYPPMNSPQQMSSGSPVVQPGAISGNTGFNNAPVSHTNHNHPHPFGNLPIQPASPGLATQIERQNSVPIINYAAGQGVTPSGNAGQVQDWSDAPRSQPQLQQASGQPGTQATGQIQQISSETPWFNQPNAQQQTNRQVTPISSGIEIRPGQYPQFQPKQPLNQQPTTGNNQMPRQWPHSPQAGY